MKYGRFLLRSLAVSQRRFCHGRGKNRLHTPVMADAVLRQLDCENGRTIVDTTFGAGGHTEYVLRNTKDTTVIALDRDPLGYRLACEMAQKYPGRIIPLLGKFSELPSLLDSIDYKQNSVDGFLFDFGCSSMQFDTANRGFSVSKNGPLDMRMDGDRFPEQPTATDVLARATEEELAKIFKVYGNEKQNKKIARAIVESRYMFRKLETTFELANLVDSVCEGEVRYDKLDRRVHNATKVFQALRIFVNNELNEINYGMIVAYRYLKIGGRLITLSFHSLEDTIVKRHIEGNVIDNLANALPLKSIDCSTTYEEEFVDTITDSRWKSSLKHVMVPDEAEININPRSRSAKLRAAIKIK